MDKKIIIAIDGYSSCGKSTLAKDLAKLLDYKYVDSGAMYRAVTLYLLKNQISLGDLEQINAILEEIEIDFHNISGVNTTFLNGENVEDLIRSMEVNNLVSEVSAIPTVRKKLVNIQHKIGKDKGIVMDGRDITTVVFPDAEIKVFVTADISVRAERRYNELLQKGKKPTLAEVSQNLKKRDHIDSNRTHSPLRQAESAFLLDNTFLNRSEQVDVILRYIHYSGYILNCVSSILPN